MSHYNFGVEIEITAKPHKLRTLPLDQELYWKKLGKSLELRGINVQIDSFNGAYSKNRERYERGWWITRDGSLQHNQDEVAFEAVSPIMATRNDWEEEIDTFWTAYKKVFHMPRSQTQSFCGGHIHVSSHSKKWSTIQLRKIAVGIVVFEDFVEKMLPASRQGNGYCRKNSDSSTHLRAYTHMSSTEFQTFKSKVADANRNTVHKLMQNDRKVLWNFAHAVEGGTGSIEFRGGRCLRGQNRTKAWIAFAVGYLHLLQSMDLSAYNNPRAGITTIESLYEKIKICARELDMNYLPPRYKQLHESESWNGWEVRDRLNLSSEDRQQLSTFLPRFFQFVFAIAVAGVYGTDRKRALGSDTPRGHEWLFATVVGIMSTLTVVMYACLARWTTRFRPQHAFPWDWLLFVFWTAAFGRFGALYIHEPRDEGTMRMKDTVWVDLVNMLLWFWTAAVSTWEFRYGGRWCVFSEENYMVDEEAQRRK